MNNIRAASVQFEHVSGDKSANLETILSFVSEASRQNVELIVFPECCITGYWYLRKLSREELIHIAEPVPDGPSSQDLMGLAKKHNMTIGAGLVEIDTDGTLYNTFVIAMPDGAFQKHRKIHCFISKHLASGSAFTVFDTPQGARAGALICYDCNIGENVRINALNGAEILLAPHQTGGCKTASPFCMGLVDPALWHNRDADPKGIEDELRGDKGRGWLLRWLPARAHDNGMFLIFSNGVGVDDDEIRTGNAMILDPYGRTLVETWKAGNDMVIADLDASLIKKSTGRRWLRTRRPELYAPLAEAAGIEEDTRKVRFED